MSSSGERNNNSNNNKNLHREVKLNSCEIKADDCETRTVNEIQGNGVCVEKQEIETRENDKGRCRNVCCKSA